MASERVVLLIAYLVTLSLIGGTYASYYVCDSADCKKIYAPFVLTLMVAMLTFTVGYTIFLSYDTWCNPDIHTYALVVDLENPTGREDREDRKGRRNREDPPDIEPLIPARDEVDSGSD